PSCSVLKSAQLAVAVTAPPTRVLSASIEISYVAPALSGWQAYVMLTVYWRASVDGRSTSHDAKSSLFVHQPRLSIDPDFSRRMTEPCVVASTAARFKDPSF